MENATGGCGGSPSGGASGASEPSAEEILSARLWPRHLQLIRASAISPDVAVERGYRTVAVKAELEALGFARYQQRVPTLLIPIRNVAGELVTYQSRPNDPRIDKKGKAIKYETPKGRRNALDVPSRVLSQLRNPKVPLFITEGGRKADAAVSIGICCIAVIGVFGWRGTNEQGGKASLPDWDGIALNGRTVYIAYDSDVTAKRTVAHAMRRLKEYLELHQAEVKLIYLPEGPGGEKVGLDDYLAAGHGLDDLLALASGELPPEPEPDADDETPLAPEYRPHAGGLVHVRYDDDGEAVLNPLTNFTASITNNVIEDDGENTQLSFELEVRLNGGTRKMEVSAEEFARMHWVSERLGSKAIVYAGVGTRDHARTAIQLLSPKAESRRVYTHTGWRQLDGEWLYLHSRGGISASGNRTDVNVRLPDALSAFELPDPPVGDALVAAVRASLRLIELAPDRISIPVYAAIWASVLCDSGQSAHLTGATGAFKSEVAALAQQHFGAKFTASRLPGSWSSTENALEAIAFAAKNALFVIDDFVPRGGAADSVRLHRTADRVLRGQGNQLGRQRMNPDGTLRQTFWPRGLILSTGEDTPEGQSLRARMLVVEIGVGDIPSQKLTPCQTAAAEGQYALAMAGFLACVASRKREFDASVQRRALQIRARVRDGHKRTAQIAGHLTAAFEVFVGFAAEIGAVTVGTREELIERGWRAIEAAIEAQSAIQQASEPTSVFLTCLRSALNAGEAHLEDERGNPPAGWSESAVGWERFRSATDSGGESFTWRPRGACVGWIVDGDLLVDLEASYRAAQRMAPETGRLWVTPRTLTKRLFERGCLETTEETRGKHIVRRVIQGTRLPVLHLRIDLLLDGALRAHEAHTPTDGTEKGDFDPTNAPFGGPEPFPSGPHFGPTEPAGDRRGPIGPDGPGVGTRAEPPDPEPFGEQVDLPFGPDGQWEDVG